MKTKGKEQKVKSEKEKTRNWFSRAMTSVLNGEFLTKKGVISHMPFILFLAGIFIAYIAVGYYFENTERLKVKAKKQLEELNAEFNTIKSELESEKQQSAVAKRIEQVGLKEQLTPPFLIENEN